MKKLSVAKRYAKALLILGKEDGKALLYGEELNLFVKALEMNKELDQVFFNPIYASTKRKKILGEIIIRLEVSKIVQSFLLLLFEKGRLGLVNKINENYQHLVDELNGIVRAELITATEMTNESIEKMKSILSEKTGKKVLLKVDQDPEIIGGIIAKIGDLILDGSLKTQLFTMKESLRRGENI